MTEAEYVALDGLGLAELVRKGEVTAAELVEVAAGRIERLDPRLNAVVHRLYDDARRGASGGLPPGPFAGVPFLLKDLLALYAGAPLTAGSRLMRGWVPDHDSEVVRRYRAAGLNILGKTNTPEFGITPFTESEHLGPCRNPWDTERTPGGSSGGSAAAVAAGMVPLAGGGDGGGSIRIPASCCGAFGLKPTRGRVPTGPDEGELWRGAVVEHVITRSVRDSAAVLDAIHGPDVGAPYVAPPVERPFLEEVGRAPGRLRVAFSAEPLLGPEVHPECRAAVEESARLLESLGHRVEEAAPPVERDAFARAFLVMLCGELRADVADAEAITGRRASVRELERTTWALALLGEELSAAEYAMNVRYLQRSARRVAAFFEEWDVLVTPTLALPPVKIGELLPGPVDAAVLGALGAVRSGWALAKLGAVEKAAADAFRFAAYTPVFNVTGQPAMSVPLMWSGDGLPIGTHIVGRFGDESMLFRLAAQLEEARPWAGRRPAWTEPGSAGAA